MWLIVPCVCRCASYHRLLQMERAIILQHRYVGLSLRQIFRCLGWDFSIVHHCVSKRLREERGNQMITRCGKRQTSGRTDHWIRRIWQSDPYSAASEIKHHIPSKGVTAVSTQTIRRCLHDRQRAKRPATVSPLTPCHHTQTLSWCAFRRDLRLECRNIFFSGTILVSA